ncbi:hypothetical protein [Sporomusa sp.]|jgi:hypothetical protein|nr:hypothetical protein [Sporomusa sp.]HWR09772.1 hypothetical protein [Sporomusa sp.]
MFGNAWLAFGVLVTVVIVERIIATIVLACVVKYYDWCDKRAK